MSEPTKRMWQIEEGGPLVPAGSKHPWENRAFWRKQLRVFILQRDILCTICRRKASEVVDHIVPFIKPDGTVSFALFSDPSNLRGLCEECHDRATATYDRGFGNAPKAGKTDFMPATGDGGRQYTSSSVPIHKLNELIPSSDDDVAALLADIPPL